MAAPRGGTPRAQNQGDPLIFERGPPPPGGPPVFLFPLWEGFNWPRFGGNPWAQNFFPGGEKFFYPPPQLPPKHTKNPEKKKKGVKKPGGGGPQEEGGEP
eukprot:FR735420.1.p3 GENE.FR735420.1~~FR735420.1.p3  ORF type:complete len:100 (+),score=72.82 FR735420.1:891-1190(+)